MSQLLDTAGLVSELLLDMGGESSLGQCMVSQCDSALGHSTVSQLLETAG